MEHNRDQLPHNYIVMSEAAFSSWSRGICIARARFVAVEMFVCVLTSYRWSLVALVLCPCVQSRAATATTIYKIYMVAHFAADAMAWRCPRSMTHRRTELDRGYDDFPSPVCCCGRCHGGEVRVVRVRGSSDQPHGRGHGFTPTSLPRVPRDLLPPGPYILMSDSASMSCWRNSASSGKIYTTTPTCSQRNKRREMSHASISLRTHSRESCPTKQIQNFQSERMAGVTMADRSGTSVLVMTTYAASAKPTRGLRASVPQSKTV